MKQLLFTYLLTIASIVSSMSASGQNKFYTKDGIPYFPISDTVLSSGTLGAIYINNTDKILYRYNGKKWVAFCSGSLKPSATGVTITTDATTTSIVTGDYTYVADDYQIATEGTSTYQWYWAVDNLGTNKTAISGATESTYDVNVGEVYIAFGVTPQSSESTVGTEVLSNWVSVSAADTAPDGTTVEDMTSTSGRIWMDRNLGASQAADSATDYNAYGSLFQWGRAADGHQLINWTSSTSGTAVNDTTSILSDTTAPSHSKFIITTSSPYDWLSTQNNNLWQGESGINTPCPSGYRLPTEAEWIAEIATWSSQNSAGAFASPLKLPLAGYRYYSSGSLGSVGSGGSYWSSTVSGTSARLLRFRSSNAFMRSYYRATGYSVRCIKDE